MIDIERYLTHLLDKGYDKTEIISKLSDKTGIEPYFIQIMYETCEYNQNNEEWNNKLLSGQLTDI